MHETLEREALWAVQTPQVFRREALELALAVPQDVLAAATDDAWLIERLGRRVIVAEVGAENLKVTRPLDLELAAMLPRAAPVRACVSSCLNRCAPTC